MRNSEDTILTEQMFDEAIDRFRKKGKKCYEFLIKSGNMFKKALFKIFQRIWTSEEIPSTWEVTT